MLGSLIALALARYRMYGGAAISLLLVLPLTTPEIVMGASLFTLFFNQGVERGFWTIVIAHTLFCLSFVAMTVKARDPRHRLDARGRRDGPRLAADANVLEDHDADASCPASPPPSCCRWR